ncbi:DUF488 domain-containing protein [uncultured Ferrovibrio sp.]|jgi:uncharacterized protein YeaO (DUF488 family)|uniref:DUF488 domain-containing protein n=1 Tax=uncultured Ferrovibrio sp. TaxID=1576913 RepID=UPI0026042C72|nr:DUF488 domain-containing protein [uncultured Ferrovibrio sp.]
MRLAIKRIYDPKEDSDGARILVDRIWPRGIGKDAAGLTLWLKEIAPSTALRQWFNHDPTRWKEFCRRYHAELDANPAAVNALRRLMKTKKVTLLYSAKDTEHNQARALAEYLHKSSPRRPARRTAKSR